MKLRQFALSKRGHRTESTQPVIKFLNASIYAIRYSKLKANVKVELDEVYNIDIYDNLDLPIKCTVPEPAISTEPIFFKNPCSPHTHPAGMQ